MARCHPGDRGIQTGSPQTDIHPGIRITSMSTNFLPPPPTNQTLIVDEFNRHLDEERRERRRRLPRASAAGARRLVPLLLLFEASVWAGAHVTEAIGEHIIKNLTAKER